MMGMKLLQKLKISRPQKAAGNTASSSFEPRSDAHAAYLKALVEKAGNKDAGYTVFGSSKHKYRLNPALPLDAVRRFERQYHLTLPEDYVFFLTKVGNGGAGPYYGLYSLEELGMYTQYLGLYHETDREGLPAFIDRKMCKADWSEAMKEAEEAAEDQEYDALMKRVCSGLLVIGTQGCTYDNLLMWKGSEAGKVVYIDWNMEPEYGPFLTGLPFLEWYERYFLEILADHHVTSYGYLSLKTEEELIKDYSEAVRADEKDRLLTAFYRFKKAGPETIEFLAGLDNLDIDGKQTAILFQLSPDKGLEVFEKQLRGNRQRAAVSCARKMPETCKDRYYPEMSGLLYCPQVQDKTRLLYFLGDCGCRRAADIAAFAKDGANSQEDRKAAVYIMGKCPDKMDYISLFRELMQGESYWLAHTALQAVSGTPCAELVETYKWMWEKYEEDKTMCSNLRIAFRTCGINMPERK